MNTKLRNTIICFLAVSLLISGCGPGQLLGPTSTPTLTPTPTVTFTLTPTSTPTPTPTPIPIVVGEWEAIIAFSIGDEANLASFSFTVAEDGNQIEDWSLFDLGLGQVTFGGTAEIIDGTFIIDNDSYVGNTSINYTIEGTFAADKVEGTFVFSYGSMGTYDGEWEGAPSPEPTHTPIATLTPVSTHTPTPTPTVTPMPQPTATPISLAPEILFQDTFSSNTHHWKEGESSDKWGDYVKQVTNGKYRISVRSKQDVLGKWSVPEFFVQDFLFSVEATIIETSANTGDAKIGILFRRRNTGKTYYEVRFYNDNSYQIRLRQDGEKTTLHNRAYSDAINLATGVTNSFGVLVKGANFTVYANGQELATVSDTTLGEPGRINLGVGLIEADQTVMVEFDNLVIKEAPADAPAALPPSTAKPKPTSGGQLTGKMVWLTGGTPVVGTGIMLCRMSGDRCQAEADLATTTQGEGAFEFQNLDAGKYVILYNPNGLSPQAAGLNLDLSDQSLQCLVEGMTGSASASCQGSVPIFGDGGLSIQRGSSLGVSASGFTFEEGSLVSEQYGVYLDFANGEPISVEIRAGQTTETVVKAWDK